MIINIMFNMVLIFARYPGFSYIFRNFRKQVKIHN